MANTKVTGDLIAQGTITTTNLADSSITAVKLNNITTDDLSEGSNLFYTDARVASYLTTNNYVTSSAIANTANWDEAYSWGDHALVGYLTSFTETDPIFTASTAASITSTQVTNWDTAYGWGDHSIVGYLTSFTETDPIYSASSWFSTTNNASNWDTAYSWGDHAGLYSLLGHTHTESEITDFGNYVTGITHDTVNTKLVVTNRDATTTDLSLAQYIDDTNLARLVSGTLDGGTGVATFTRDDSSTFTVDFSAFLSDANDYVSSASFNTSDGVLTLTRFGGGTVTVDLDNRYLTSFTETDPVFTASAASGITLTNISNWDTAYGWGDHASVGYLTSLPSHTHVWTDITDRPTALSSFTNDAGFITSFTESDPTVPSHVKSITTTNVSNWNTAYGWGNHASAGYLTSLPSHSHAWSSISADTRTNYDLKFQPLAGNYAGFQFLGENGLNAGYLLIRSNSDNFTPYTANGITLVTDQGSLNFFARGGSSQLIRMGTGSAETFRLESSYSLSLNSSRAPIFYDSDNTGYYVDPASTSVTNAMQANNYLVNGTYNGNFGFPSFSWGGSTIYPTLYSSHPDRWVMHVNPHIVWMENGQRGYAGATRGSQIRFEGNLSSNRTWDIGCLSHINSSGDHFVISRRISGTDNWAFYADPSYNIHGRTSMRAPIFYDRDNTSYYVDSAGVSSMSEIRFQGSTSRRIYGASINGYNAMRMQGNWDTFDVFGRVIDWTGSNLHFGDGYNGQSHSSAYMRIGGGGNINYMLVGGDGYFEGDVIAYYSDARLKQNVKPINNALDVIKGIRGVTFEWNKKSEEVWKKKEGDKDFGLIAQEVEAVFPMGVAIQGAKDINDEYGYGDPNSENYDPLHTETNEEEYKTVRYDKMVSVAIQAIKEQQEIIDTLKIQIEELKSLINK